MALKGTLKDFGIADILQLIGQQTKTGKLDVTTKQETITVSFQEGNIVGAQANGRNKNELIGAMLVRAGKVSQAQLDFALESQKRTLQRLGDVLIAQGVLSKDAFRKMVELQTQETLYRLFHLKSGHYSFEQGEVDVDVAFAPLRAENVLMEGFRRVDEWPGVRRHVSSTEMTFEKLKDLPPQPLARDDFDEALDDAFAEPKREKKGGEFQAVGQEERTVFQLVSRGRTAQEIIDRSSLGEFEASKALANLVNLEYLKGIAPAGKSKSGQTESSLRRFGGVVGRVLISAVALAAVAFLLAQVDGSALRLGSSNGAKYTDPAAQRFASTRQLSRISAAIEMYRLERGTLPEAIDELSTGGFLSADDLRYPWREHYFYRKTTNASYVLLPPLH
jgi:Domain of unknown function (DUF4388)